MGFRTVERDADLAVVRSALDADGFAVLDESFSPDEVREVEELIDRLLARLTATRSDCRSRRYVRDMAPACTDDEASERDWSQPEIEYAGCFSPELLQTDLFQKCRRIAVGIGGEMSRCFDHAIYKPPNNGVATDWHQDGAFSHARFGRSHRRLHFWIPLQDASVENGCMHFIPGSHRAPLLRHRRFVRRAGKQGLHLTDVDDCAAVACPVPLGGMTVHGPRTLHYAGPNRTNGVRKAWIIQFAPFGDAHMAFKRLIRRAPKILSMSV